MKTRYPISINHAINRIKHFSYPSHIEQIPISTCLGSVLAQPVIALHDLPPFDRSTRDGYAIRTEDTMHATLDQPVSLQVTEHVPAGDMPSSPLQRGEAVRIMTGAPLPALADAVVMLEHVHQVADQVHIRSPLEKWSNISHRGEDAKQGDVVIPAGSSVTPGTIALLASLGYHEVSVYVRPTVAIIATGSELLQEHEDLQPGRIRDSNRPMLEAQLTRMGVPYRSFGIVADEPDRCLEVIQDALSETDVVITTGGVSVGDYDVLPEIYRRLEAQVLFDKVAIRPGSVTTAANFNGKWLFGLSGNPTACYVGFELFVRPALHMMMGNIKPYLHHTRAKLAEDIASATPYTRVVHGIYELRDDRASVRSAGFDHTSAISTIAKGNSLILLPAGIEQYTSGMEVDVLLLGYEDGSHLWNIQEVNT